MIFVSLTVYDVYLYTRLLVELGVDVFRILHRVVQASAFIFVETCTKICHSLNTALPTTKAVTSIREHVNKAIDNV